MGLERAVISGSGQRCQIGRKMSVGLLLSVIGALQNSDPTPCSIELKLLYTAEVKESSSIHDRYAPNIYKHAA